MKKLLLIIITSIILDQLSKYWLINLLPNYPNQTIEINRFLNFVYVWNHGISFGLFNHFGKYSNISFLIVNIFIISYLILLMISLKKQFEKFCLALIIGGALGNLFDRITKGAVFDFIDIHYKTYHFAIFNLADSFITIGITLFIISEIVNYNQVTSTP